MRSCREEGKGGKRSGGGVGPPGCLMRGCALCLCCARCRAASLLPSLLRADGRLRFCPAAAFQLFRSQSPGVVRVAGPRPVPRYRPFAPQGPPARQARQQVVPLPNVAAHRVCQRQRRRRRASRRRGRARLVRGARGSLHTLWRSCVPCCSSGALSGPFHRPTHKRQHANAVSLPTAGSFCTTRPARRRRRRRCTRHSQARARDGARGVRREEEALKTQLIKPEQLCYLFLPSRRSSGAFSC